MSDRTTGIEDLAALIAVQELIHNLVVNEQRKGKKTGKYKLPQEAGALLHRNC
jgi:hypothetical protein